MIAAGMGMIAAGVYPSKQNANKSLCTRRSSDRRSSYIERNNQTQWWIKAAFFESKRRSLVPVMMMVSEHEKDIENLAWKTVL